MNTSKIIIITLCIFTFDVKAMGEGDASKKRNYADFSGGSSRIEKSISIRVPQVRNAVGVPSHTEEKLDLNQEDIFSLESFSELIKVRHAQNKSFLLARVTEQVEDGVVVQYFEAGGFNRAVFGQKPFQKPKPLARYKHPISKEPLQALDYYECDPSQNVLVFMCTYAALCSHDEDKRSFLRYKFQANQDNNLKEAVRAMFQLGYSYQVGRGTSIDYSKAMQLYKEVSTQKFNISEVWLAKNNTASMLHNGQAGPRNYPAAKQLYEEVIDKKKDLKATAFAMCNLGHLYQLGQGVNADHARAKQLYKQAELYAQDIDDAALTELLTRRFAGLEEVINEND